MGFFLVNDMQRHVFPLSKRVVSIFWSKITRNVLKRMKNQLSHFYFLRHIRSKMGKLYPFCYKKKCNVLKRIYEFFRAVFSFWDMVDYVFTFAMHSGLCSEITVQCSLLTTVEYKIDHISKTENRTKKNSGPQRSVSEHCSSFFFSQMDNNFPIFERLYLKK